MVSKTISLEESAYLKLKAAKQLGESFSQVVHRLLKDQPPSLLGFADLFSPEAAEEIYQDFHATRKRQLDMQQRERKI